MSQGRRRGSAEKRRALRRPLPPQVRVKKQERRSTRRRLIIMALFVLLTLFLTLAMIRLVIRSTAPEPKLYIVREGTIVSELYERALLVRDEVLLDAPAGGTFLPAANDGDKVRKNQVLGRVISPQGEALYQELEEIKYKISTRQLELMAAGELGHAEMIYESTDDKLLPLVNQIRRSARLENLNDTAVLAERMQVIVDERNERLMDYAGDDEVLNALLAEKQNAETRLAGYAVDVKSPLSGLVSYAPDSLTALLNADLLMSKTPKEMESIMKKSADAPVRAVRQVNQAEDIAFIVRDVSQYIAFLLPDMRPGDFPDDRSYEIEFPEEGVRIENARVVFSEADNENLFLLFKSDTELAPLINRRFLNAKILLESERGLKVPKEALRFPDEHNSSSALVMLVRSGYVYEEQVEVLKSDEDYAIIASPIGAHNEVTTGSIIVQNPAAVSAGEQLGG